ncbi:Gamma-glutamylcyclotransferase [Takifugu flavidus]|uniref:Gamma-glutamylcyclotransferase n=1 Tax=Takifugu flavidus TaxID=433684 RepID=A0A5C6PML1_9TELE|nr:Gamma-glutamylcyclotransferase [Takifugu flavidus]
MENNHTFLYFAYGSNLLKERLQLKNPSAIVHCVARLKDYKLVFGNHKGLASDRWHGGVATIEHSPGDEVWGVVWKMNISDLESLDDQENVMLGAYSPVELSVKTKGQEINCRTYIMNSCVYAPPSPQYLQAHIGGTLLLVASWVEEEKRQGRREGLERKWPMNHTYMTTGSSKKTAHNVSVGGYGGIWAFSLPRGLQFQHLSHHMFPVIVMGAQQNGLPKYYQEKLRAIKTNMYYGPLPMMAELEARRRAKED